MKTVCGVIFILGLSQLIATNAEDVDTSTSQEANCESRLATTKTKLEQAASKFPSAIQLDMFGFGDGSGSPDETAQAPMPKGPEIGKPHWPSQTDSYVPPIMQYLQEFGHWLRDMHPQWGIAAVAFVLGAINVLNGPASFKAIVITSFSLLAAGTARYDAARVWPQFDSHQQLVVAVEVFLVMAYALHKSFQGTKILFGAILGAGISALISPYMFTEFWPLTTSIFWYSTWVLAGVLSMTAGQGYTLASIQPLLGGFLCSSAVGYFVKKFVESAFINATTLPAYVQIRGDCWLDFAGALLGFTSGAGVIKPFENPGLTINFDSVLGRLLWFFIFFCGAKLQWKRAKRNTSDQITSLTETLTSPKKQEYY